MRYIFTALLVLMTSIMVSAQQGTVKGIIFNTAKKPLQGVTVVLSGTGFTTETDKEGRYEIAHVPDGEYTLVVMSVNIDDVKEKIVVSGDKGLNKNITVHEKYNEQQAVTVLGLSAAEQVKRQAYNVVAIDARKLYNSTLDLSHALDRVSGVRVRETGGVGSRINFSLNGFSGNQVRFFLDGIPMENLGSSFQINNIPINFAERVEVYKGVVPIWLGSDALGGAVNIVTGNRLRNYVDVSYSYGSFNTHRTTINAAVTSKKGLTLQLNAFQNYSENNYKVTLDVADINTGAYSPNTTVRRFHDRYHNETLVLNTGFLDKKWADKFLVGITLGKNYSQIQTGARMTSAFGSWYTQGNIVMPSLKYMKKDMLVKGLDVTINANYNLGEEQIVDTLFRRYDWYGNYKQFDGPGGERSRTLYKYSNNVGLSTATFVYRIGEKHTWALNNVASTFNRKGYDALAPNNIVNKIPQKTVKDILGLSYKYDINKKWAATVFGKYLYQLSKTQLESSTATWNEDIFIDQQNKSSNFGYGLATSYYLLPSLQVKLSYEKSNRLPENNELFGDNINQENNFNLKPERSDNVNIGLSYSFGLNDDHRFMVGATGIYRDAKDYIYFRLNNNQAKVVADNLGGVRNLGGEAELKYSFKNLLVIDANITYQDIRNMMKYEPGTTGISAVYKDRIPNLPYLFGNASASLFFGNVLTKQDNLSFGYNLLYVNEFFLYWPSRGKKSDKHTVPTQVSHDVNMVYAFKNGRYNVALECKNITDAKLYDNFSLQKPGRAFYVKLRYFLNR